jgi:hypothetical protein
VVMNPDQITAWRDYLAGQMHEQHGVATHDARKTVTRWLRSLEQGAAPQAYQVPEVARICNERRGLRIRPAAGQARSARA